VEILTGHNPSILNPKLLIALRQLGSLCSYLRNVEETRGKIKSPSVYQIYQGMVGEPNMLDAIIRHKAMLAKLPRSSPVTQAWILGKQWTVVFLEAP
jgi:hypothetical protein